VRGGGRSSEAGVDAASAATLIPKKGRARDLRHGWGTSPANEDLTQEGHGCKDYLIRVAFIGKHWNMCYWRFPETMRRGRSARVLRYRVLHRMSYDDLNLVHTSNVIADTNDISREVLVAVLDTFRLARKKLCII